MLFLIWQPIGFSLLSSSSHSNRFFLFTNTLESRSPVELPLWSARWSCGNCVDRNENLAFVAMSKLESLFPQINEAYVNAPAASHTAWTRRLVMRFKNSREIGSPRKVGSDFEGVILILHQHLIIGSSHFFVRLTFSFPHASGKDKFQNLRRKVAG